MAGRVYQTTLAVLTTLALTAPLSSVAFDPTSDAPIRVEADNARLDDRAGTATYTGDVIVSQGETQLSGDRLVIERIDGELGRMQAEGEPARYQQAERDGEPAIDAEARTITYSRSDNIITLEEDARIRQDNDTFSGDRILYNTTDRTVTASGDRDRNGRVEMVIQPRRDRDRSNGN